ncbi:MAG TPA: prepilin-type N-terminal cleavage/methylation domain-containing protein [Verrucomicrobiae bacterium]|nr:prepilin-type N-terminal cleavage/methylation domain-containing protein [Verrucomicrobiae bacterium]
MKLDRSRKSGFTLVEIMIVVAIIGLLAAIAIPNFARARTTSQANACINNLRQIDGAKQTWALEHNLQPGAIPVETDVQPYLGRGTTGQLPFCPADSTSTFDNSYTLNDLQTPPACQIVPSSHKYN